MLHFVQTFMLHLKRMFKPWGGLSRTLPW